MSIVLYYGSGSPYAWRVQLALEHKALPYERKLLSFSAGDTRTPEFLALNPRHRVPVIVDGDFVLYESTAIVEYLDEAYPGRGVPLFPGDVRQRALVRRLVAEADNYLDKATDDIVDEAFSKKPEERDAARQAKGEQALREEFALLAKSFRGDYFAGPLSAADFALYPVVAYLDRCAIKLPGFVPSSLMPPAIIAWKARIEALPFFDATYPPHWKPRT